MKNEPNTRRYAAVYVLLVCIAASCDTFKENDVIRPSVSSSDYYTTANGVILIDLTPLTHFISSASSFSIVKQPEHGFVSRVSDLLFRYEPRVTFTEGTDHIIFVTASTDGTLSTHTIMVHVVSNDDLLPCGTNPIQDRVKLVSGSSVTIHPLDNDHICGDIPASLELFSEPKLGEVTIQDQSLVYTPGENFTGYDEFIYSWSKPGSDSVMYGLVSVATYAEVTTIEPHAYYITQSVFLNNQTGFMFVGNGLDKTTDGGEHWSTIWERPWEEPYYCYDLFFLDEDRGYAAFGTAGLLWTTDGWNTWQTIEFDATVAAVAFTSPDVGYAALETGLEQNPFTSIVRTDDGGATWEEVIAPAQHGLSGKVDIQFFDALHGYVRFSDQILSTTDGGITWQSILFDLFEEWVEDICVTSSNDVYAVITDIDYGINIFKWSNGGQWVNLPRPALHTYSIRFSPTGEVGYAVVRGAGSPVNGHPELWPLLLYRTQDGGLTWDAVLTEVPVFGIARDMHVPSDNTVYIEDSDWMIKYVIE
ncbi:MAG TPA: Ig-like domain-containing protein [Cyclobacteriaceae bacterium]